MTSEIMLDGKKVSTYHYVMTRDFPYSVGCFKGTSVLKGPSVSGGEGAGGAAPTGADMAQNAGGAPPAEAQAACKGSTDGASCSFTSPRGDRVTGICQNLGGTEACAPAR